MSATKEQARRRLLDAEREYQAAAASGVINLLSALKVALRKVELSDAKKSRREATP